MFCGNIQEGALFSQKIKFTVIRWAAQHDRCQREPKLCKEKWYSKFTNEKKNLICVSTFVCFYLQVLRDWNSWDNAPRTVEEHIEVYREKLAKPITPTAINEDKNSIDLLFSELEPNIIKQTKVLVKDKDNKNKKIDESPNFSRLEATSDIPIMVRHFLGYIWFWKFLIRSLDLNFLGRATRYGRRCVGRLGNQRTKH